MSKDDDDDYDTGYGALGGGGAQAFDKVTSKIAPDGVHTGCNCGWCGTRNDILCSWDEAIMGGMGYPAPNWYVDQGALYPRVGCANSGCRHEIGIRYSPQELNRYVSSAVEAGYLQPAAVQQLRQQVSAAAGARR